MQIIAIILTAIVAIEHLYILWMEMFAWETAGKKAFGRALPHELFRPTKGLAANQGLYNGFWSLAWFGHFSLKTRNGVSTYVYSFLDVLLLPESLVQ